MKNIKNIFLCSDFLSTNEKEQRNNLKWIQDLLSRSINFATNKKVKTFIGFDESLTFFNRNIFFSKSNLKIDSSLNQIGFKDESITEDSKNYLKYFLPEDSIIIGYELSNETRNILDELNFIYIDIWLNPIRFYDDILFSFSSNHQRILESIYNFHINDEIFYHYADRIKIQSYKGWKRLNFNANPNSALIIGQTLNDKALIEKGSKKRLSDYSFKVDELCEKYNKVYYSKHPFITNEHNKEIKIFKKKHSNFKIIKQPAYRLLSNENIKKVVSISSSVVQEAHYFEKETEYFFKPVINLSNYYIPNHYASICQDFIFPYFWSQILHHVTGVNCIKNDMQYLSPKDKLRDMLAFYWSYKEIDKIEYYKTTNYKEIFKDITKKKIRKIYQNVQN
jgi:hypothetical protein